MSRYIIALIFLVLAILSLIVGIFNYNSRNSDSLNKDPYSFFNQFPYELQDNNTMKYNLAFRIAVALLGASYAIFGINEFLFIDMYTSIKVIHDYILSILFIIVGISMFLTFLLNLRNYNYHLLVTSILFSSTVALYGYLGFYVFVDPSETYHFSLGIICIIFAVGLLVALLVTPLKKWMYLEKEEKDGRITYHRKRLSILPFMEWIFLSMDTFLILIMMFY